MPAEPGQEAGPSGTVDSLMIEIGLKPGEVPLRIPVTVQNFMADLLTLKVTQTMNWVEWEALPGHDSHLRLPKSKAGESETIPGKVSWIKTSGPEGASIFLGMEVSQPSAEVQKLLEDQVLYTPKDMKDLWQQWDQVQVKKRRSAISNVAMLIIGVILLALGAGLLGASGRFPGSYGYGVLAVGGFLTLLSGVRFWWERRV
jgi:hypothetical protein